jgi:L-cystine transport system permease protein
MRPFKPKFILDVMPDLLPFLSVTLSVIVITVIFGSLLGLILARARIRKGKVAGILATGYISTLRCTPAIVLLFIVYYGLPKLLLELFGININGFHKGFFVIIAFVLIFAASMSEVMRSAYEAIDKGQYEAAVSIGLSNFQAFYRILLPQMIVVAIPNFANALVSLMKESSLAYTIGLIDMMGQGTLIVARNYGAYALETYIALALIFWTLTVVIEKSFSAIERSLSKGSRHITSV